MIHDPLNVLHRFSSVFDQTLFSEPVVRLKLNQHTDTLHRAIDEAEVMLRDGRPRAALSKLRVATNELIMVLHWRHKELPRSQNRTASRFKALSQQHRLEVHYDLFRDVFALGSADEAVREAWPLCREETLALTGLLEGQHSRDFFTYYWPPESRAAASGRRPCGDRQADDAFGDLLRVQGCAGAARASIVTCLADD